MSTYIGSLTVGDAVPGAFSAVAAGTAGINGALPDIEARLLAMASFTPTPVDFAAQLALAQQTVAGIELAISLGISPPDISAQLATIAAEIAALTAQIAAVNAQLAILTGISGAFSAGGLHAWAYSGQVGNLGADMSATLATGVPGGTGPTQSCNALVLIATSPATWAAVSALLKVTP